MPFAAFDLHKREIEACVLDDQGRITHRQRFACTAAAIAAFAQTHLSSQHQVALEATFNTWAVVDVLAPYVASVTISNPLLTRAIAQAKIKTGKIDCTVLGHLLRLDYLPPVWRPDPHTRELRLRTTERATLTQDRTRLKNRIHGLLNQRLIAAPPRLFDSPQGLPWLKELALGPVGRRSLDRLLAQLELTEKQIQETHPPLAELAYADQPTRLLMTLPGVGAATAWALRAALGDITRFASPDRAAAYLGLVPSTSQSGERPARAHSRQTGRAPHAPGARRRRLRRCRAGVPSRRPQNAPERESNSSSCLMRKQLRRQGQAASLRRCSRSLDSALPFASRTLEELLSFLCFHFLVDLIIDRCRFASRSGPARGIRDGSQCVGQRIRVGEVEGPVSPLSATARLRRSLTPEFRLADFSPLYSER